MIGKAWDCEVLLTRLFLVLDRFDQERTRLFDEVGKPLRARAKQFQQPQQPVGCRRVPRPQLPFDEQRNDRGGKLLFVGGWADGAIAPASNTDFYESVARNAGRKAADSVRLFMVPDMGHCPAAPNARNGYAVDTAGILEAWRQSGKAPDSIVVSRRVDGVEERKVLVCKYPQVAYYRGSGDPKIPDNFVCR